MKRSFYLLTIIFFINLHAQNADVVSWINSNAITIEDANPDTPLTAFAQNVPKAFEDARIFGFGEATHNTKEFFDLKAKFFKYLVKEQGVRIFIMEESYYGAYAVNKWLAGGEGDARALSGKMGLAIWRCEEVAGLLQWMKDYNHDKPQAEQIRFYGMDDQFGYGTNTVIRDYVNMHRLAIDEALLKQLDSCTKVVWSVTTKKVLKENSAVLEQLKLAFINAAGNLAQTDAYQYQEALHAITVLQQFTNFSLDKGNERRDSDMFENVKWVIQHEGENSKAFIWAHNDHINKHQLGGNRVPSVGSRLKDFFGSDYYSMGFDFGRGWLYGSERIDGKFVSKVFDIDKPFDKTYASVFINAEPDIFLLDFSTAEKNEAMKTFLEEKKEQLSAANGGYDPKQPYLVKKSYLQSYDGLIFVKTVSVATY